MSHDLAKRLNDSFSNDAEKYLLACFAKKENAHRTFFNEYEARLSNFACAKNDPLNTSTLVLEIEQTNFAFEVCTTYVLDPLRVIVRDEKIAVLKNTLLEKVGEIRRILASAVPGSGAKAFAANPIGLHVNLVCFPPLQPPEKDATTERGEPDKQLVVMRRGPHAALQQGEWSTTVSGVMVPLKESIESAGDIPGLAFGSDTSSVEDAKPSVFRAVQRELEEELFLHVPVDHIRVLGLLSNQITAQPLIVAEAYTHESFAEVQKRWRVAPEKWEIKSLQQLPLSRAGLDLLFSNEGGGPGTSKIPRPDRTTLNMHADSEEDRWGMRYAVAVLMTFCRHVGSEVVERHLQPRLGTP